MSRVSRRTLFTGAAAAAGLAAIGHVPGARLIRAQGAEYEIVSFGPVQEGVLPEGYFRPNPGGLSGIHGSGVAFGNIAASNDKFYPAIFDADGSVTKLKSGEFGGDVAGVNAAGDAVGTVYESARGIDEGLETNERPAIWRGGDLIRLPLLEAGYDGAAIGGYATAISDDGKVFGYNQGVGNVLWVNDEPQELPYNGSDSTKSYAYLGLTPNGSLIVRQYDYDTEVYSVGLLNSDQLTKLSAPESNYPSFTAMNSRGDVMFYDYPTDAVYYWISRTDGDPIVIDYRADPGSFHPVGFNADQVVVGFRSEDRGLEAVPALWQEGAITLLQDLLPADHGFDFSGLHGISDDGIISASAFDVDLGFHPLLLVPA